ncbi:MAG: gamma-glutamyltransferase [Rhodanobacter sp.]
MIGAKRWFVAALTSVLVATAASAAPPAPASAVTRPGHAGIASASALATEAGLEILRKGGNAFDAAVAVGATLSVVEPESSGIGGGFLAVLHRASDGHETFIDAREVAPAAVNARDYVNADGTPNRDVALNGPLAAGIPGAPAGWALISRTYGKLPLATALAPAVRIARDGFVPDARLHDAVVEKQDKLTRWPASAAKYLPAGKPPLDGARWRDPDQARTLELLGRKGADGFYAGEVAAELVSAVRAAGGNWSAADLAGYQAKERAPLALEYRGYRIVTAPPPSSGGVAIAEILNILRGYDLSRLDMAHRVHLIVEAMRRAFRDHNDYLGDPDFVSMPLDMLLSPFYADGLRQGILADKATPSSMLPRAEAPEPGMHTTHYSIIDADGNMAAVTATVNTTLGSGFVAGRTGVLLNNEMDDFALVPNKPNVYGLLGSVANAPAPGKRMLSSMSPSIVIGKDRTAVIGSPGGSTIITQVLEGILHFIDGESAQQIVAHKRFHHQYLPDVLTVETGAFDEHTRAELARMGHAMRERDGWGFMNVVVWDHVHNQLQAASDPRHATGLGKVQ